MTEIHNPDFNSPSGRKIEETKITREDVEQLKVNWAYHPIWDIEDTEGFEGFRDELFEYRKQEEAKWEAKWKQETQDRARELGVSVETIQVEA